MKEAADMEDATEKQDIMPAEVIPARELLADMLLVLNNSAEALDMYEISLKRNPNRFNSLYGSAVAAKNVGDQKKATKYFDELLKLTEGVDSDRAELEEAREYVGNKLI
jgi:tetratricopeptide (TPR) repeat protein